MKKILMLVLIFSSFSVFGATDQKQVTKLKTIFPDAVSYMDSSTINSKTYIACYDSSNKVIGYFVSLNVKGVSDKIKFDLGIDKNGKVVKIANVDIGHNKGKYNKQVLDVQWQNKMIGRDKNYNYNAKVDATAGASVSPRVITEAVKAALIDFDKVSK